MEREDKLKALDAALSQIERQYGKGAVMKLGDNTARMNVETGHCTGTWRYSEGTYCGDLRT